MDPCDVLLLDASLDPLGGTSGLAWLAGEHHTPVVFLADAEPGIVLDALRQGAHQWLPRPLALGHPEVLAAVLRQAARHGDALRRLRHAAEALDDCQRQVSRLVGLLWEASPGAPLSGWLPQRCLMERLHEEVARAQRHGGPLAVVLGEAQGPWGARPPADEADRLGRWVAERLGRAKRRCDVAGQYGPHGFLLLLPGTTDTGAACCCRRLRQLLEASAAESDSPAARLHVCFGVANYCPATPSVKSICGGPRNGWKTPKSRLNGEGCKKRSSCRAPEGRLSIARGVSPWRGGGKRRSSLGGATPTCSCRPSEARGRGDRFLGQGLTPLAI
jgi:PleD family two-component response regulator